MKKRQFIRIIFLIPASILLFFGLLGIKLNILKTLSLSILLYSCVLYFIITLVFLNKKMEERKKEIEGFQEIKLTGDYSDFNFKPHILVIDEFTALAAQLSTIDKTTRERAFSILHNVFLEGRQLGFFVFIIMQKSDSNYIPTALRENIPLKIVFGNSGEQTYKTAFGSNTKVPNYNFELGEGVFTDPDISNEPEIVQFPTLDFDILGAIEYLKRI